MLIAMDTTGPFCTAGLYDIENQKVIDTLTEELGRGHAERLMPMLEELVEQSGLSWQEISKVGCTVGPGSFTGLRVGIAAARGLSLALDCPVVGVSVFQAIRYSYQEGSVAVILDAKRDQVWMQCFDKSEIAPLAGAIACPIHETIEHIPDHIRRIVGSGACSLSEHEDFDILSTVTQIEPEALLLSCMAAQDVGRPTPMYLRAPDAKPQPTAFGAA